MGRQTREYRYDFRGHNLIPLTASNVGTPWSKADTSSSGTPTLLGVDGGGVRMLLQATTEVQNLCLYFGDILSFDIDDIIRAWFILKAGQTFDSNSQFAWGLTGARNDAIDSIAQAALFRCIANNTIVVETDDGTNDNDDKATGITLLSTQWSRFEINFADRILTKSPPAVSVGNPANVGFYAANAQGSLRRVASGVSFDMSNYTGGLQPFFQLQKSSDSNADYVDILECGVEVQLPLYA
jgi:hypothetical protein